MPEHQHASEAIYHPIPQAPVASNPIPTASPDLDLDDEAILSGSGFLPPQTEVDSKIRWAHFMLGCAVLLPWNGACRSWLPGHWEGYERMCIALITATPYFQSRVAGTSLKSVLSSYMSMTFTASNFVFLAHATATAKKVRTRPRVAFSVS